MAYRISHRSYKIMVYYCVSANLLEFMGLSRSTSYNSCNFFHMNTRIKAAFYNINCAACFKAANYTINCCLIWYDMLITLQYSLKSPAVVNKITIKIFLCYQCSSTFHFFYHGIYFSILLQL